MENVVTINNTKKNVLEFDMSIQGLDAKDVDVKFVIKTKNMDLAFKAKHDSGDKWSVTIPELPMVERTAYKCCIVVVADGFFFEPMKGTVNVVGSHEIYSSKPKNVTLEPEEGSKKKVEKKTPPKKTEVKESLPLRAREKTIEQLARELMSQHKEDTAKKPIEEAKEKSVPKTPDIVSAKEPTKEVTAKPVEEKKVLKESAPKPTTSADENARKVIEVLESVGIQPRTKRRRRFSINVKS